MPQPGPDLGGCSALAPAPGPPGAATEHAPTPPSAHAPQRAPSASACAARTCSQTERGASGSEAAAPGRVDFTLRGLVGCPDNCLFLVSLRLYLNTRTYNLTKVIYAHWKHLQIQVFVLFCFKAERSPLGARTIQFH